MIELLAVLVILAIIALIAVPIIQNMIRDSRKNATLRSAEFYIDAINKTIASMQSSIDFDLDDGTYNINSDGNLCLDDECSDIFEVEVENTRPTSGSVDIENNRVASVSNLYFPKYKYDVSTVDGSLEASKSSGKHIYNSGDVVYFDVASGSTCSEDEYKKSLGEYETIISLNDSQKIVTDYGNSKSGYNGIDNKDANQNSCLKFYVVGSAGNRVTLILDHNTTSVINWNTIKNLSSGPSEEFLLQLKNDTKDWKGTLTPKNYNHHIEAQCYNDDACSDGVDYTIDYSGYTSRILSIEEAINIMGITSVDPKKIVTNWGSIDFSESNLTTAQAKSKSYWLVDRLLAATEESSNAITENDQESGYHTQSVSLYARTYRREIEIEYTIWNVKPFALRHSDGQNLGIRPVIEVSKDKL